MIHNYIRIAFRQLRKHAFYSLLNLTGLATAITFVFLIGQFVWSEFQVNRTLHQADRQYILLSHWKDPNMGLAITTLAPLSKRLREEYPTLVANYYRWDGLTSIVTKADKQFRESIQLGDPTFLSMYGLDLLYGDAKTALQQPFSLAITEDKALTYFGRTDVVGQTLTIQNFSGATHPFTITAVLKNIPENSITQINATIKNTFFTPTNTYTYFNRTDFESWQNGVLPSYVELQPGVSPSQLAKPIQRLIDQNASAPIRANLRVEPLALTTFYRQKDNGLVNRMLITLTLAGLFILLMAVVNGVNLAISQSASRLREIGVRKALGSLQKQLITQLVTESVLLAILATGLALCLYPLVKPFFEQLVGKTLMPLTSLPPLAGSIPLAVAGGISLLAGLYPAFRLSSRPVIDALQRKQPLLVGQLSLRQGLVSFQFLIAIMALIGAVLVTQQVRYMFSQALGYNQAYVISAQVPRDWSPAGVRKLETSRRILARLPTVASVSLSHEIPNGNNGGQPMVYQQGTDSTQAISMQALVSDEHYLQTYQIPLVADRFFLGNDPDSLSIVLNEKAVKAMGYQKPGYAIGKQLRMRSDPRLFTVVGVSRDFHFNSMQQAIQPMLFFSVKGVPIYRYLSFKLHPGAIPASLEAIQQQWSVLFPNAPFEYQFMDQTLEKLYQTELQLEEAAYLATVLALLVVVLGLVGLVSLSVIRRAKEIGIRKVLGASVVGIMGLFVAEYAWGLLLANVVAWPLIYWLVSTWLADYTDHIQISWTPFVGVGLVVALFTALLISFQSIKAALVNPVESLKSE